VAGSNGKLVFPALSSCPYGADNACYGSNNDLTGASVERITINDTSPYLIDGHGFTLGAGGLQTTSPEPYNGSPVLSTPITLGAPQTWAITGGTSGAASVALTGGVTGSSSDTLAVGFSSGQARLALKSDAEIGAFSAAGFEGRVVLEGSDTSLNGTNGHAVGFSGGALLQDRTSAAVGPLTVSDNASVELTGSGGAQPVLSVNGAATFQSAGNLILTVKPTASAPAAGTDYAQLSASGDITLSGVPLTLQESSFPCSALTIGDTYTIAKTTGGSLTGTFFNAAEGAILPFVCPAGGVTPRVRIHYTSTSVTATVVATNPSSSATAPAATNSSSIEVDYTASDNSGSGLDSVDLYAKGPTDSAYTKVGTDSSPAASGHHFSYTATEGDGDYSFYTRATDKAANVEDPPGSPDATTTLDSQKPTPPSNATPPSIPSSGNVGDHVSCKPGNWTGSPSSFAFSWTIDTSIIAGQHASTYTLAAGDAAHTIRCQVVAHNESGDSAPATSNALSVAKPPSSCHDTLAPTSKLAKKKAKLAHGKLKLKGSATDKPCHGKPGRVVRVIVTISRHLKGGCRFLSEDGQSFGPLRKCDGAPPIVFPAKGTSKWSLKMPAVLPAGRYTIRSRATDRSGNTERVRKHGKNVLVLHVK
jgi:hypothetical protein